MGKNYSFSSYSKENMARVIGKSLPISFKQSIEICNFIRNKDVGYAKNVLNKVIEKKRAIPFRRFNDNMGHKNRIAAGRYPGKASKEILDLISLVEANAQFKGMNSSNLVITHINANKAATVMHYGRKRSRKAKRTNIEIVVKEMAGKKGENKKITEKKTKESKPAVEAKKEAIEANARKESPKKQETEKDIDAQPSGKNEM
ncbi:50S ribosomal protein L22 [Candidatus Woesearchaeota archaeon]|nr:50S ribosomal protein L22 [Candidatus Woesearchaeota archaeon]